MFASKEQAPYLPFVKAPEFMAMGLGRLDAGHWIEPDDALPAYYDNKLAQRGLLGDAVYQALPESAAAQRELHGLLLPIVRQRFSKQSRPKPFHLAWVRR